MSELKVCTAHGILDCPSWNCQNTPLQVTNVPALPADPIKIVMPSISVPDAVSTFAETAPKTELEILTADYERSKKLVSDAIDQISAAEKHLEFLKAELPQLIADRDANKQLLLAKIGE